MTLSLACALALLPQGSSCDASPVALQLGPGTLGSSGVPSLVFEGAPLFDHPVALRAEAFPPAAAGLLLLADRAAPTALPSFGATLFPSAPFATLAFAADSAGAAPLVEIPSLSPGLCGTEIVAQALAIDAGAQGGVSFTRAIQLVIGERKPTAFYDNYAVPMGVGPEELVVADLNLDGVLDLVSASSFSVTVATGGGNGQFRPEVDIHGQGASAVVVGLVNADPFPDIVASRRSSTPELWFFPGDGSEDYDTLVALPTLDDADSIALGDFNADGRLDLAVASDGDGLGVHFGQDGATPFGSVQLLSAPLRLSDVVVADFNGDGLDDMAACDALDSKLIVRLGSASGSLVAVPKSPTGFCPDQIVAGDWDGDGLVDLLSAECGVGGVTKLKGQGNGLFGVQGTPLFPTQSVRRMALSDMDLDGALDIVYANLSTVAGEPSRLYSNLGAGNGSFSELQSVPIPPFPESVLVADLDLDGVPDVLTYLNKGALLTYGEGGGLLSEPTEIEIPWFPSGLSVADLDGDGRDDVTVADIFGVTIYSGEAAGLSAPSSIALGIDTDTVRAAHVDADLVLDLVVTTEFADLVRYLPGVGDGSFGAPVPIPAGERPRDLVVADFNGDSHADFAVLNVESEDITVALGDGNGGFASWPTLALPNATTGLDVGDINQDGRLDLIAVRFTGEVRTFYGNGFGSFFNPTDLPVVASPSDAVLVDIDEDGLLDIVGSSTNASADGAWLLRGQGGGSFAPVEEFSAPNRPTRIEVADVDGDRVLDLVLFGSNNLDDQSVVLRGIPGGTFAPPLSFMVGDDPRAFALGRFGDDLMPDVFIVRDDNALVVFESRLLDD